MSGSTLRAKSRSSACTRCGGNVIDRDPESTCVRTAQAELRVGVSVACAFCGIRELAALQEVKNLKLKKAVRRVLEEHHVLGRALDSQLKIFLCRNHHAIAHEALRRAGVPMIPQENVLDRMTGSLWGLSAFQHDLQKALERYAAELNELRVFLDDTYPGWRDLWRSRK